MTDILHLNVPVPQPHIKRFTRWQVFKALFDRNAHFTTCDTLIHQLHVEAEASTRATIAKLCGKFGRVMP